MAANRKVQSTAARFGPALKAIVLCSLIGVAGVGYVNQKNKIQLLGEQMRKLEIQRDKLRVQQQILLRRLTALHSPSELEAQVRKMNLDLAPAPPDCIVHLTLRPAGPVAGKGEVLFAEQ
jgi:hypothetical protein